MGLALDTLPPLLWNSRLRRPSSFPRFTKLRFRGLLVPCAAASPIVPPPFVPYAATSVVMAQKAISQKTVRELQLHAVSGSEDHAGAVRRKLCFPTKELGKPDAGKPPVRFDEGREADGHWHSGLSISRFLPTLHPARRDFISESMTSYQRNHRAFVEGERRRSCRNSDGLPVKNRRLNLSFSSDPPSRSALYGLSCRSCKNLSYSF